MKNALTYFRDRVWGAYASRVWPSASRRRLLHAAQIDSGSARGLRIVSGVLAEHLFPSPPSRSSQDTGACGVSRARLICASSPRMLSGFVSKKSVPICLDHLQKNINHFFENHLNLKLRELPFNPAILVQNPPHTISPLTPYGLVPCAISAGPSALNEITKSPRASRCPATALKVNKAKRHEKNSQFFSGHFARKTLANQAKTAKKTPQKHAIIVQLLTCFPRRNLSIKVKMPILILEYLTQYATRNPHPRLFLFPLAFLIHRDHHLSFLISVAFVLFLMGAKLIIFKPH